MILKQKTFGCILMITIILLILPETVKSQDKVLPTGMPYIKGARQIKFSCINPPRNCNVSFYQEGNLILNVSEGRTADVYVNEVYIAEDPATWGNQQLVYIIVHSRKTRNPSEEISLLVNSDVAVHFENGLVWDYTYPLNETQK